jgi:hypothetical protein
LPGLVPDIHVFTCIHVFTSRMSGPPRTPPHNGTGKQLLHHFR